MASTQPPGTRPSLDQLWRQAGGDTPDYSGDRYRALLIEHGHIIPLDPGEEPEPLPCRWPGAARDFDPEETNHG